MSKPRVIGWEHDPTRFDLPEMPEISIGYDGEMYVRDRVIEPDKVDAFMRRYGWKRRYAPRNFHATPKYGGYLLHCRRCGTNTLTSGYLPHDSAVRHRCPDA